ncbi:hypothetical protein CEXT_376681 [Caerostris extrusa]|uniref:Uncharacterized protein n=1 Tax=Caerostris extrusa TaxID=172846 RepID=A0AAV4NUR6_CAEEX|nr:hypothetical protein CEXT_376681 [Caerostris extrusa]
MMALFMGVKINMDCFDLGIFGEIFGVSIMLIIGIVIHKLLNYDWNNLLVIWRRRILTTNKCLSITTMKFIFVIFDLEIFGDISRKLINRFVTVKVKMLVCGWKLRSLILDAVIDSWRSYVALKRLVAGMIIIALVEAFLMAVCFLNYLELQLL